MFGRGVYLSVFYCLYCVKQMSTNFSQDQMSEERYLDLNQEEGIRLDEIREEHWGGFAEGVGYKKKIRSLRWDVYVKEKQDLIRRYFLVSVTQPKGGSIVQTCVKDNIIEKKEEHKALGLRGFDYKLFGEEEGGGVREVLDGYLHLKHIIQLWPGDWVNQMENLNEMVGINHCLLIPGGKKLLRLVRTFRSQEFWKYIGCIPQAVTYGMKRHKLWRELPRTVGKNPQNKLHRYIHENTNLYQVCFDHYRPYYCHACH